MAWRRRRRIASEGEVLRRKEKERLLEHRKQKRKENYFKIIERVIDLYDTILFVSVPKGFPSNPIFDLREQIKATGYAKMLYIRGVSYHKFSPANIVCIRD